MKYYFIYSISFTLFEFLMYTVPIFTESFPIRIIFYCLLSSAHLSGFYDEYLEMKRAILQQTIPRIE